MGSHNHWSYPSSEIPEMMLKSALFGLPKAVAKSEVNFGKNSRWNPNIGTSLHLVETIIYV